MSGSSRAAQELSRCIVTIDAGIRISWATNPDGSYPGTEYHRKEEEGFVQTISASAPELEAIIDQFAVEGREFLPIGHPDFNRRRQTAEYYGFRQVFVDLAAVPLLKEAELAALAKQFAAILGEHESDETPGVDDDLLPF